MYYLGTDNPLAMHAEAFLLSSGIYITKHKRDIGMKITLTQIKRSSRDLFRQAFFRSLLETKNSKLFKITIQIFRDSKQSFPKFLFIDSCINICTTMNVNWKNWKGILIWNNHPDFNVGPTCTLVHVHVFKTKISFQFMRC